MDSVIQPIVTAITAIRATTAIIRTDITVVIRTTGPTTTVGGRTTTAATGFTGTTSIIAITKQRLVCEGESAGLEAILGQLSFV